MLNLNLFDTEEIQRDPLKFFGRALFVTGMLEYEVMDSQYGSTENGFVNLNEKIKIKINPTIPEESYQQIVDSLSSGDEYLLHNTRITIPDENIPGNSVGNNSRYQSDAFSHYNIKNIEYEQLSEINNERLFPNFLLGALWNKGGGQYFDTVIEDYYSMFNQIPQLINSHILSEPPKINGYEFDNEQLEFTSNGFVDYQLEQAKDYYKVLLNNFETPRNQYVNANTHVFVDFSYNQTDSSKTGNTPFFNRIKLPFDNLQLSPTFPNNTFSEVQTTINSPSAINSIFSSCQMKDLLYKSFRNSNSFMRNFTINGTNVVNVKVYDLLELISNVNFNNLLDKPDEMILRDPKVPLASKQNNPFLFFFYKLKLTGKMRNTNKINLMNFEKLFIDGEKHKKENVGFKILKRLSGRDEPIQTFYFTNRLGLEDFVDTQIRFDRVYTYEVISLYAIYGTRYSYSIEEQSDEEREIVFNIQCNPSIKIAEIPVKTHTMRKKEPPPMTPEISFFNEKRTKNKVKILFEHQDGNHVDEYNIRPMRSFGGNQEYLNRLFQYFNSNNILMKSGKTSDGIYEIYRLEEPPKSILDFENSLIAVVQSGVVYSNGQRSKNCVFVDYIKHQTKYYYAFRVLTHRGNQSELSEIYEVEMYEDADETFLTYGIYQMPEVETFSRNYKMRKYLQIVPSFEHTINNQDVLLRDFTRAEDALPSLALGQEDLQEKLFDHNNKNKFIKLRLESKNSGKKLDLNLLFDIKKQTN